MESRGYSHLALLTVEDEFSFSVENSSPACCEKLDANWLVCKSGCPAISIAVTFCPSYEGKMSIVCGEVLGVSRFACAKSPEGVANPKARSRTANIVLTHAAAELEGAQTPRWVWLHDRTGCTYLLLLILPHYWMQDASAAVLRGDRARLRGMEMEGIAPRSR